MTARVRKNTVYILDVFRRKLDFPNLIRMVQQLANDHSADVLLIEDAASGQQLIQCLIDTPAPGVPTPIPCKPEADKVTRMLGCSAQIEVGNLALPGEAPWLAELEREILAFPNGKNDDQSDAPSQLLSWVRRSPKIINAMPFIDDEPSYWFDED